jgi:hypothetical protein
MKSQLFLTILLFCYFTICNTESFAQTRIDSSLAKKITVSGFCLCKTTVKDLQNLDPDIKSVDIEEMDAGKNCIGEDARFVNGKGYYSEKYPGLIFQKDPEENYFSKIRLTKGFVGNLPGGIPVDLNNLLLKDIIKDYPEGEFKWSSRDCSDYWKYSNDTISFFLKIDRTKKPQYPLDEDYYLNRPVDGIDVLMSCYSIYHKQDDFKLFADDEPMFFIDSIRTNQSFIKNAYKPSEIAMVSVYKGDHAIAVAGKDAKNGAIYITTKSFARNSYWNYFKSKSPDYKDKVPDLKTESKVVYILNNKILDTNFEAELFQINDANFLSLQVITPKQLKKDYHLSGKSIGVVITTNLKEGKNN